jgi:FKBP-type peptidyl-prolyl cis-trans isomerase SlyD
MAQMSDERITAGKLVALTYRIEDLQGRTIEHNDVPVTYIHGGQAELIGGMDEAVQGCRVGDQVELIVTPEQGFGPSDPSLIFTDDIENVPPELRSVGAAFEMKNERGETRQFHVTRIGEGTLTLDGNHPLAGRTLRVHVRIEEVRDPTHAELVADLAAAGGRPDGTLH